MGTKAYIAIGWNNNEGKSVYGSTIIGMTMDGSIENLKYFAHQIVAEQKKQGVREVNNSNYKALLQAVVDAHEGWLFLDNYKNPSWVSHSALVKPANREVDIYYGYLFEDFDGTYKI